MASYEEQLIKYADKYFPEGHIETAYINVSGTNYSPGCDTCGYGEGTDIEYTLVAIGWDGKRYSRWLDQQFEVILKEVIEA